MEEIQRQHRAIDDLLTGAKTSHRLDIRTDPYGLAFRRAVIGKERRNRKGRLRSLRGIEQRHKSGRLDLAFGRFSVVWKNGPITSAEPRGFRTCHKSGNSTVPVSGERFQNRSGTSPARTSARLSPMYSGHLRYQ